MSTKTLMVCPECHYETEDESKKICPICFMKYNKTVYLEAVPVPESFPVEEREP